MATASVPDRPWSTPKTREPRPIRPHRVQPAAWRGLTEVEKWHMSRSAAAATPSGRGLAGTLALSPGRQETERRASDRETTLRAGDVKISVQGAAWSQGITKIADTALLREQSSRMETCEAQSPPQQRFLRHDTTASTKQVRQVRLMAKVRHYEDAEPMVHGDYVRRCIGTSFGHQLERNQLVEECP